MNEVIGCGGTKMGSIEALLVRLGEEGEVCCCSTSINTFKNTLIQKQQQANLLFQLWEIHL